MKIILFCHLSSTFLAPLFTEVTPCDSHFRPFLPPELFKHCSDLSCTYTDVWSIWEEMPESRVDVPNEVCPSRKMGVNIRYKNATKAGCDRKQEKKQSCK